MTAPNLRSIKALLTSKGSQLNPLTAEAQQLIQLRDTVRRQLSSALAPHCSGAQLDAGTLVIYMDSAASATPVRYQQRELLSIFIAEGLRCTSIKVQVLPTPQASPMPKAPTHTLSETARQILESTAEHLADGRLKDSLQRLARNRDPRR